MSISANHKTHCANWRLKNPNYSKDYYKTHKAQFNERTKKSARKLQTLVDSAKNRPCMDCGLTYHPFVMDLDHRPGENKVDCVSNLTHYHASIEIIRREIAKCDVVCSNCHRLRTLKRKQKCL